MGRFLGLGILLFGLAASAESLKNYSTRYDSNAGAWVRNETHQINGLFYQLRIQEVPGKAPTATLLRIGRNGPRALTKQESANFPKDTRVIVPATDKTAPYQQFAFNLSDQALAPESTFLPPYAFRKQQRGEWEMNTQSSEQNKQNRPDTDKSAKVVSSETDSPKTDYEKEKEISRQMAKEGRETYAKAATARAAAYASAVAEGEKMQRIYAHTSKPTVARNLKPKLKSTIDSMPERHKSFDQLMTEAKLTDEVDVLGALPTDHLVPLGSQKPPTDVTVGNWTVIGYAKVDGVDFQTGKPGQTNQEAIQTDLLAVKQALGVQVKERFNQPTEDSQVASSNFFAAIGRKAFDQASNTFGILNETTAALRADPENIVLAVDASFIEDGMSELDKKYDMISTIGANKGAQQAPRIAERNLSRGQLRKINIIKRAVRNKVVAGINSGVSGSYGELKQNVEKAQSAFKHAVQSQIYGSIADTYEGAIKEDIDVRKMSFGAVFDKNKAKKWDDALHPKGGAFWTTKTVDGQLITIRAGGTDKNYPLTAKILIELNKIPRDEFTATNVQKTIARVEGKSPSDFVKVVNPATLGQNFPGQSHARKRSEATH